MKLIKFLTDILTIFAIVCFILMVFNMITKGIKDF